MHKPLRSLVSVAVISVLSNGMAQAGAFSLYTESSTVSLGNYAAGVAAEAADASTGWYNPAGLALIHNQQAVFSGIGVFPTVKESGVSTFTTTGLPDYVESFSNISGGESAFVPSFHYALPLGENATFGLSMLAPFGLSTDWGPASPVRYEATLTELITTNLSPELGAKINEHFSVGAGLDLQYARVKFNRILGFPTLLPAGFSNAVDTITYNKGNSFGVGFHAGVMAMFNDNHTRVGANYQSRMRHTFHGYSQLTGKLATPGLPFDPAAIATASNSASLRGNDLSSNPIDLPDIVTVSAYHDINETVALLGSVVYTGWSSFKTIQLNNLIAPTINPSTGEINQVRVNNASAQNYKDAMRFSLGVNYHINPLWMLRVGGGYDATPTNNVDRDMRLPDASRWALSVGGHYQMRPNIGFDVGYTHLFAATDPKVNHRDALGTSATFNVNANGSTNANLVGAQVVWTIDPTPVAPTK